MISPPKERFARNNILGIALTHYGSKPFTRNGGVLKLSLSMFRIKAGGDRHLLFKSYESTYKMLHTS